MVRNLTFYFAIVISLMGHAIMLVLFYIEPVDTNVDLPAVTRVSFTSLDWMKLEVDREEGESPVLKDDHSAPGSPEAKIKSKEKTYIWRGSIEHWPKDPLILPKEDEPAAQEQGQVNVEMNTQRKVVRLYYPPYPLWAKRLGVQSDVSLKFQILRNGQVGRVLLDRLSGYPELDLLAMRAVRRWSFEQLPADVGQDQWGSVTLKFRLQQGV